MKRNMDIGKRHIHKLKDQNDETPTDKEKLRKYCKISPLKEDNQVSRSKYT